MYRKCDLSSTNREQITLPDKICPLKLIASTARDARSLASTSSSLASTARAVLAREQLELLAREYRLSYSFASTYSLSFSRVSTARAERYSFDGARDPSIVRV